MRIYGACYRVRTINNTLLVQGLEATLRKITSIFLFGQVHRFFFPLFMLVHACFLNARSFLPYKGWFLKSSKGVWCYLLFIAHARHCPPQVKTTWCRKFCRNCLQKWFELGFVIIFPVFEVDPGMANISELCMYTTFRCFI